MRIDMNRMAAAAARAALDDGRPEPRRKHTALKAVAAGAALTVAARVAVSKVPSIPRLPDLGGVSDQLRDRVAGSGWLKDREADAPVDNEFYEDYDEDEEDEEHDDEEFEDEPEAEGDDGEFEDEDEPEAEGDDEEFEDEDEDEPEAEGDDEEFKDEDEPEAEGPGSSGASRSQRQGFSVREGIVSVGRPQRPRRPVRPGMPA